MSIGDTIDKLDSQVKDIYTMNELAEPWYADQVLPFDVTLSGANEYGAMCAAKILGVEILNEGSSPSIDDAVTEMQATFVARAIEPMQDQVSPSLGTTTNSRVRGRPAAAATVRHCRHTLQRRPDGVVVPASEQGRKISSAEAVFRAKAIKDETRSRGGETVFSPLSIGTYGTLRSFPGAETPGLVSILLAKPVTFHGEVFFILYQGRLG